MTWRTHLVFGIDALWLLVPLFPVMPDSDIGILAAAAAFGALLPDLDASESRIKHLAFAGTDVKPFAAVAQLVHATDSHRGLLHSLAGLGLAAVMAAAVTVFTDWPVAVALLLGYASHLVADSATKSGVRWLYPSRRRYFLLPRGIRFTTDSQAEDLIFVCFAATAMGLLLSRLT